MSGTELDPNIPWENGRLALGSHGLVEDPESHYEVRVCVGRAINEVFSMMEAKGIPVSWITHIGVLPPGQIKGDADKRWWVNVQVGIKKQ